MSTERNYTRSGKYKGDSITKTDDGPCVGCRNRQRCKYGLLACITFAHHCKSLDAPIMRWRRTPNEPNQDIYNYIFSGDEYEDQADTAQG